MKLTHWNATAGQPTADGEVRDSGGAIVAYIESDGSVGNACMEYLGEASHAGHVVNKQGEVMGEVCLGDYNLTRRPSNPSCNHRATAILWCHVFVRTAR